MRNDQPYVGHSAFAHKGGVHVSAVLKDSSHLRAHHSPRLVGNRQRVLLSDLSGRGNMLYKLKQHGLGDRLTEDARRELLERIKQMEYLGYELEAAEGTFELLVREALHPGAAVLRGGRLRGRHARWSASTRLQTTRHGHPQERRTAFTRPRATGHGPMNALDLCLRQCLAPLYPAIADVRLTDYKVRVLDSKKGTAAKVRVLIEWSRSPQELGHRRRLAKTSSRPVGSPWSTPSAWS